MIERLLKQLKIIKTGHINKGTSVKVSTIPALKFALKEVKYSSEVRAGFPQIILQHTRVKAIKEGPIVTIGKHVRIKRRFAVKREDIFVNRVSRYLANPFG